MSSGVLDCPYRNNYRYTPLTPTRARDPVTGLFIRLHIQVNELSPPAVRGTFPGLAYQLGNLLSSRNSVIQAKLAEERYGGSFAPVLTWTVVIMATLVAVITWLGGERKGADLSKTTRESLPQDIKRPRAM